MADNNLWLDDSSGGYDNSYAYALGAAQVTNTLNAANANYTNYKNTKATNETNLAINLSQMENARELLAAQQMYNSPSEQRKMLAEAGYSPYAFLDDVYAKPASQSTPNVIGAVAPPPQVVPESPLNYFNAYLSTAKVTKDMQLQDAEIARKMFDLGIDKDSVVDTLNKRYYEAEKMRAEAEREFAEGEFQRIQNVIENKFGADYKKWQVEQVKEAINLIKEEGMTEKSKRALLAAEEALNRGRDAREAQLNRATIENLASATERNRKEAKLIGEKYENQRTENFFQQKFGYSQAESTTNRMFAEEDAARNMATKLKQEADYLRQENATYESRQLIGIVDKFTDFGYRMQSIRSMKISDSAKQAKVQQEWKKLQHSLSQDEKTIVDHYYNSSGDITGVHTRSFEDY